MVSVQSSELPQSGGTGAASNAAAEHSSHAAAILRIALRYWRSQLAPGTRRARPTAPADGLRRTLGSRRPVRGPRDECKTFAQSDTCWFRQGDRMQAAGRCVPLCGSLRLVDVSDEMVVGQMGHRVARALHGHARPRTATHTRARAQ